MASPLPPLDLNNVQGDILAGLPKKTQTFLFFQIEDYRVHEFRTQLAKLVPLITTTVQVLNDQKKIVHHKKSVASKYGTQEPLKTSDGQEKLTPELLEMSGVNLAFSKKGLEKIGLVDPDPHKDTIGDPVFTGGMLADASHLGDQVSNWTHEFKKDIHGLIMITGDSHSTVEERLAEVKKIFLVGETNATIHQVLSVVGDVRKGHESGHEHFGFADGISQPAVQGLPTDPNPGHGTPVRPGIILLGRDGDPPQDPKDPKNPPFTTRPPWTLDGSFLCFRLLLQRVPEFNAFLKHKATPDVDSELLGARLVGRWKSGAPIDLSPLKDDLHLANDPSRNNNFRYDIEDSEKQERCPFAAHTRKTNPRSDLDNTEIHRIIRRGIPFGPEVSREEAVLHKTFHDRGLLFVAYQSNIGNGFQFIQTRWANSPKFPFPPKKFSPTVQAVVPGQDPIIGQTNEAKPVMTGTDPKNTVTPLSLPDEAKQWVVSKGGEYFFSPSIPALKNTFALAV